MLEEKKKHHNAGKPKSEETKRKMSEAARGKPKSEQHKQNISKAHLAKKDWPTGYTFKKDIVNHKRGENHKNWRGGSNRICPRCKLVNVVILSNGVTSGYCRKCANEVCTAHYHKKKAEQLKNQIS